MTATLISRLGHRLIKAGARLPRSKSLAAFQQKSQLLDLIRAYGINCVLDVGANKGWFSESLRRLGFTGDIFSFEPIRSDYEAIAAMAAGDARWKAFNFALGDKEETREFNIVQGNSQTVLSSFLKTEGSLGDSTQTEKVEIRTIDSVFPSLPVSSSAPRIFLKTDTQGYDINVVRGAAQTMPAIKLLQAEIAVGRLYQGAPHYTEALGVFEGYGFRLIDLHIVSRDPSGTVHEYDCLMAKPSAG